jgi:hypothetical protein
MTPEPIILDTETDLNDWMDDNSHCLVDRFEDICYDGGYSFGHVVYKIGDEFYKLNFHFDDWDVIVYSREHMWRGDNRYYLTPVKRKEVITYEYEKY